ncbi:MAG: hypothetical protein HY896_03690 [Deltaproteobacteria bacterium]|nr:hypothetical protein [Deltaproteobacteria bacterium]
MRGREGSAIVLAMLLLVLLNAIGMYAVSRPVPVPDSARHHHQSFVARNMARGGAHAAIAQLPSVFPEGAPYVRRIPSGEDATGRYSVTSQRIPGAGYGYRLVSEGTVPGSSAGRYMVRAEVRMEGGRTRIVRWEEIGPAAATGSAER